MDGIFVRKKVRLWLILLLVVTLFAARYLLRHIASPETAGKPTALIVYGVVLCLFGIPAVLMNHGKCAAQGKISDVLTPERLQSVYDMDVYQWMRDMLEQWR